ncbi:MAG: hypothetical protein DI538_25785 [Azospira oryzae]|nr:MAG: hypothetical protein DI538_25785 [Azospira oryzae]
MHRTWRHAFAQLEVLLSINYFMIGKYTREQLEHGGDTQVEHDRLRAIFDDLVDRGRKGIVLSMIEKDFVYHGITFFNENPNNFPFVDDARFKHLYLTYGYDITGGSIYLKVRRTERIQVPLLEKENDLNYLTDEADKWEKLVALNNHKDQLLQLISAEFRNERKELDISLNISGQPQLAGSNYYQYKVWGTYLRARIVYIYTKQIFEETSPADCIYSLCGETIEFTQYSMAHIINRHFAEVTKQFNSGKDYHLEDIIPWIMPSQLKSIISEIDKSGLLKRQVQTELNFRYKGQIYQVWATLQYKQVKGQKGNIQYKRIDSFYPVSDPTILAKLTATYKETVLNDDISLFVPI